MKQSLLAAVDHWRTSFRDLVLSFGSALRYTQDCPILSDVWMYAADHPDGELSLIVVPDYKTHVPTLVSHLAQTLESFRRSDPLQDEAVWLYSYEDKAGDSGARSCLFALSNDISARLTFEEMVRILLPLTNWWSKEAQIDKKLESFLDQAIAAVKRDVDDLTLLYTFRNSPDKEVWRLFAIIGLLALANADGGNEWKDSTNNFRGEWDSLFDRETARENLDKEELEYFQRWMFLGEVSKALINLDRAANSEYFGSIRSNNFVNFYLKNSLSFIKLFRDDLKRRDKDRSRKNVSKTSEPRIWKINLNRRFELAVSDSRKTVKADAAEKLFDSNTDGITWAVVDSGIDATHPSFARRQPNGEIAKPKKAGSERSKTPQQVASSRVTDTFDFNRLDHLLKFRFELLVNGPDSKSSTKQKNFITALEKSMPRGKAILVYLVAKDRHPQLLNDVIAEKKTPSLKTLRAMTGFSQTERTLEDIRRFVLLGREIRWELIEPIVRVTHDEDYYPPKNPHGTHVAGILCGDLRKGELSAISKASEATIYPEHDLRGVCPSLQIIDLRVAGEDGNGEEFIVLAALQFMHYLNRDRDKMRVQGANISLALKHDIRNFACGRTPICMECERLVANGVVVVTAAGNAGVTDQGFLGGNAVAYNDISITDPGNAESVISVGATHRKEPHSYGISYFSSRGPTGDGRQKPDLVAPGEKIVSCVPGFMIDRMDGTSMAAPHVSGAAAMLMARHKELIRNPAKVKATLCATATDLGREKRFQGAGLLDILRAIQSL